MNKEKLSIATLMEQSGVKFGTSGARGLVNAMTDRICYAYTVAFLEYLHQENLITKGGQVAFAGDLRPSTPGIMAAVYRAISDCGFNPINTGFIPSPALALFGIQHDIPSIMVTGSHIPDDRNGIKFNRPDGEILKQDELGIRQQQVFLPEQLFDVNGAFNEPPALPAVDSSAHNAYVRRYIDFIGVDALKGLRVGLYEHSGVARTSLIEILQGVGADVVRLGYSDTFIPVDTEAIRPQDIALGKAWSKEFKLDSVVSTDGDGDRPLISDESGQWLRGDVAGILCAGFLDAKWVVTPVSSNSAVELSAKFEGVVRTRIGSPFVITAMQALLREGRQAVVGYEANGGFLSADRLMLNDQILEPLPTRDAVIVILSILMLSRQSNLVISELVNRLPARFTHSDRLKAFPTELSQQMLARFQSGDRECRYLVIHFRISLSKNDSFTRQLFPFAPAVLRSPRLRIPHRSKLLVPHAIMAPTMTLRR
ncbi:MAG: phosphomannomutase [Candidatus Thiodiazotropha sp. (ex. Lucinoma kazani)]